ncbi:MAG: hypothetical protein J6J24_05240 [Clostridia bacterium]|nr:hypothetical protein [Clostridia bacterium]
MKLTSTKINKEEFDKLWEDEVTNHAHAGFDYADDGAMRALYVKDAKTGVLCCYIHQKKKPDAVFVSRVKKNGGVLEIYEAPSGNRHTNVIISEDNKPFAEILTEVLKKDADKRKELYREISPSKVFGFAKGPAETVEEESKTEEKVGEEKKTEKVDEETTETTEKKEENKKSNLPVFVRNVEPEDDKKKGKKGCFVKLAAGAAAVALALGLGFGGYKLAQRGKDETPIDTTNPPQTEQTDTTNPPQTEPIGPSTDKPIGGDSVIQTIDMSNEEVKDAVYNAIVRNVDVDIKKEDLKGTFLSADEQVVFAMTEMGLFKLDLSNGGANKVSPTTNDTLIAQLKNTDYVKESYKFDYLLGTKYTTACEEFVKDYQDQNAVETVVPFVTDVQLGKTADNKGFMVSPTVTVCSMDKNGNIKFEEYASDKVTVAKGVQLSGIDMVATSLFADLGFVSEIYTVEDVAKNSVVYGEDIVTEGAIADVPATDANVTVDTQKPADTTETTDETEMVK